MKLEVGQFVRVKGHIGKIANINEFREPDLEVAIDIPYFNDLVFVNRNDIIKASHDIIDLIEVGDYVNGYKVIGFDETYFNGTDRRKEPKRIEIIIDNNKFEFENHIKKEDIKTILTKEQFDNYCYKIRDDE